MTDADEPASSSTGSGDEHPLGLEPGEQIHAHVVVSLSRTQRRTQRSGQAPPSELPIHGLTTTLAVTDRRLIAYRPTFVRGRPRRFAGAVPMTRVAQAAAFRKRLSPHVAIVLDDGAIHEFESYGGMRAAKRFAQAIVAARRSR